MHSTYAQTQKTAQKKEASTAAAVLDASSQNEGLQRKADMANGAAQREEVPRPNNTGMPDNLKSGIESLSGFSMDDVRVHYNSSKPATVQALAYTQGTDIHVAPGQEKHLPHEAWHVAQQMAGRVSPTTNINGMPVNDNAGLEHEADVMGVKAVQCKEKSRLLNNCSSMINNVFQGKLIFRGAEMTSSEAKKETFRSTIAPIGISSEFSSIKKYDNLDEKFVRNLVDDVDYYYVGKFRDIKKALVRIAKQFQIKHPKNDRNVLAKCAIVWLYNSNKENDLENLMLSTEPTRRQQEDADLELVSGHLAEVVANELPKKKNEVSDISEFSEFHECYYNTEGTKLDVSKIDAEKKYRVCRTMLMEELNNGKFKDRAGDFLQAASYSGDVLVECEVDAGKLQNERVEFTKNDGDPYKSEDIGQHFLPKGAKQYSLLASNVMDKANVVRVYHLGKIVGEKKVGF